ncbi:MAG: sulfatase-like hydrolase/transferase [Bacteroidia bacterium]|nr:sulfatase-like hydrolase/transferase [Bacteroidia bacterium]
MIDFLALLGTLGLITACQTTDRATETSAEHISRKPNIIFILADDLGYGDLKSLNPDSKIPTPNMDKLVKQGIHFSDAHSNSAVCTPTRYGILTGRYAFRTPLKRGVLWGYSPPLIEPGQETVASFLQKQGYHTACVGKWHLGLDWVAKDKNKDIPNIRANDPVSPNFDDNVDYTQYIAGGPADHGFDYSLIIPASLDMSPYCYLRNGTVVAAPTQYTEGKNEKNDGRGVFWRAGKVAPGFDFYTVLPTLIDSARQYIERQAQADQPFFLYLALPSPHTPWLPATEYQDASQADTYGDFVAMTDQMIGSILQTIEKQGIDDNTLIIVTSDNGADWRPTDLEEHQHRANHIYRGRKADIYEAGHRVPFLARWNGVIPASSHSHEIVCTTDLMATLSGLLQTELPPGVGEDSYNLWPAFLGKSTENPIRPFTIHHSLDGFFAIRQGNWKFTPHLGSGGFTDPKVVEPQPGEAPGTLYDLKNDPQEQNNLYKQHPEVVKALSQQLEKIKNQKPK